MICLNGYSQNMQKGRVEYIQDPRIDTLLNLHKNLNEYLLCDDDNYQIKGYRVQIFFDSGNNSSTRARGVTDLAYTHLGKSRLKDQMGLFEK